MCDCPIYLYHNDRKSSITLNMIISELTNNYLGRQDLAESIYSLLLLFLFCFLLSDGHIVFIIFFVDIHIKKKLNRETPLIIIFKGVKLQLFDLIKIC